MHKKVRSEGGIVPFIVLYCLFGTASYSQTDQASLSMYRWWPVQQAPKGVVIAKIDRKNAEAELMLVQSLAGLTAQAVNQGRLDEMVWVYDRSKTYDTYRMWYERAKVRIGFEERGSFNTWELVSRYQKRGVVKGYVLYSQDPIEDSSDSETSNRDQSINIATTLSGILQGIIVEQGLETKAEELGLVQLADARGKTFQWCFNTYKDQINRRLLLTQTPRMTVNRDVIIANKAMAMHAGEKDPFLQEVTRWIEAASPVAGWWYIDEGKYVSMLSRAGRFILPGKSMNLCVLGADSHNCSGPKVKSFDPSRIDWQIKHTASFFMSDGDNFGWATRDFCLNPDFWANPHNGAFPFGWGVAASQLSQACPDVMDFLAETKPENVSLIEASSSYWYPDIVAVGQPDRKEILTGQTRKIGYHMNKRGIGLFTFICQDVDSDAAKEAYQIFAEEIPGLVGMIALQYVPNNGGGGQVMWFKNKEGIEIPVITPTYWIWRDFRFSDGGSPDEIAKWINQETNTLDREGIRSNSLVVVHCWSDFADTNADADSIIGSVKQEEQGLTPVKWCVDQIASITKVVSPEELVWRIRMEHNREQTRRAIAAFK